MGCSTQPLRPGTGTRRPAALPIPQWWRRAATALPGIPASAASAPAELEGPRSSSPGRTQRCLGQCPPRRRSGAKTATKVARGPCAVTWHQNRATVYSREYAPSPLRFKPGAWRQGFIGTVCGMLDARFVLPGSNASASSLCGICRGKTLWSIRLLACLLRNLIGITSSFAGKLLDYATFKVLSSASETH